MLITICALGMISKQGFLKPFQCLDITLGGSIIVWRLGGFGHILDTEYGFCKEFSAVYGFSIATRLRKRGF